MTTSYDYAITDFQSYIDIDNLRSSIPVGSTLVNIELFAFVIRLTFETDLTVEQQTSLDSTIREHQADAPVCFDFTYQLDPLIKWSEFCSSQTYQIPSKQFTLWDCLKVSPNAVMTYNEDGLCYTLSDDSNTFIFNYSNNHLESILINEVLS